MGLFSFLFGRHKCDVAEETEEEDGLELGMVGAEVTPISVRPTATAQEAIALTLPLSKLNNRLERINKSIKKWEDIGGREDKVEYFKERKEKTKALLWIYYDVETK